MSGDDILANRKVLAAKLIPCVIRPSSVKPGQRVVVFAYTVERHEAEIVAQGIYQQFRQGDEGLEIILTQIPDDDEIVTDSLAHRGIEGRIQATGPMEHDDSTGLALPESVVQARDLDENNERLIVVIQPNFLLADGKKYADRHAEDNIVRRTWRSLPE
jgi:hypothetical protein